MAAAFGASTLLAKNCSASASGDGVRSNGGLRAEGNSQRKRAEVVFVENIVVENQLNFEKGKYQL